VRYKDCRTVLAHGAFGLIGALLMQAPAAAHLGGDIPSVNVDRAVLHAQLRTTSTSQYNLHEISIAPGTLVREYATPQGTVFAVTWQGPLPANLHQLLGGYYAQYQSAVAVQSRAGMHRQLNVAQPDLVVQSTGRLRAFRGKAYVPSLVPAGVSVGDLP
jgi:Protein of unknown function (DUF2844)